MSETKPVPIRERTRRLVQTELTVVAQDIFLAQGYADTTVDQNAAAAGMSRRTFFRYFRSKDDLVIGKYDLFGDRMAEALDDRPKDEPEDHHQRARSDAMEEVVRSTPQLQARYLARMQRVQELLISRVAARLINSDPVQWDPVPAAIVGAAFASMQAARQAWFASDKNEAFAS